jgi:hypothetical protein
MLGEHKANMLNFLDGRGPETDAWGDRGCFPLSQTGGARRQTVTGTADGIHGFDRTCGRTDAKDRRSLACQQDSGEALGFWPTRNHLLSIEISPGSPGIGFNPTRTRRVLRGIKGSGAVGCAEMPLPLSSLTRASNDL